MQRRLSTILFLIGVIAVIVMLMSFEISFSELWSHIYRAGYWFVAAVLLWGALYGLNALTLRIIICGSGPCPVGFGRLWQIVVSGFALNTTIPVGGIGGEPYRIKKSVIQISLIVCECEDFCVPLHPTVSHKTAGGSLSGVH